MPARADSQRSPRPFPNASPMKTLRILLKAMRPRQWTKNLIVFAALIFDVKFTDLDALLRTLATFVLFCMVSSAVYLLNDLVDIEKDRAHPTKRNRPLAAGTLKPQTAIVAMVVLLVLALPAAFVVDQGNGVHPVRLLRAERRLLFLAEASRHHRRLDGSRGIRAQSGGWGGGGECGAVFALAVRLHHDVGACSLPWASAGRSLVSLEADASNHRAILDEYTEPFLDQLIGLITGATIVAYSIYTFSAENLPENHLMMLTIPFVIYFLFRYLYLVQVQKKGGAPDELLFEDKPLFLTAVLWGLFAAGVLFFSNS